MQLQWSQFQRKDGRWCAERVSGVSETGKRTKAYIYARSEDELQFKIQQRDRSDIPYTFSGDTIGEWLNHWLDTHVDPNVKPNTASTYRSVIKTHVMPVLGWVKLHHLTDDAVRSTTNPLVKANRHETARLVRAVLKQAFDVAQAAGHITSNPTANIRIPKGAKAKLKVLTEKEASLFLNSVVVDPLYPLWMILLTMGLRSGEVRGLQWGDIDLRDGLLTVERQLQWVGGTLTLVSPKSASAHRTLPIPHVTLEALVHYYEDLPEERRAKGQVVFLNREGRYISPVYLRQRFHKLLTAAGIPDIRLHDLRHSCATLLIGNKVPMKTVQEWLGHSSYQITADIYAHVTDTMLDDAATAMNGVFA